MCCQLGLSSPFLYSEGENNALVDCNWPGRLPVDKTKAKIAQEITRIHCTIMKVPEQFVRVIFLSYPEGSGVNAGEESPTACLNCVFRSGHTAEEKAEMLEQLWSMFQDLTGVATDQLALSLQEIPSQNAMELGQILQPEG